MTDLVKLVQDIEALPDQQYAKLLDMLTLISDLELSSAGKIEGEEQITALLPGTRDGQKEVIIDLLEWLEEEEEGQNVKTLERLCALYLIRMRKGLESYAEDEDKKDDTDDRMRKEIDEILAAFEGQLSEKDIAKEAGIINAEKTIREGVAKFRS